MIKHLVMFSGGICSYWAAKRVVAKHGTENVTLLFADTKMEDEDLYRFLEEAAANVGAPLVKIADGRTPWEVMKDKHIIANSRIDPCSEILKRKLLDKWRNEHGSPETTTVYVGLDWTETDRLNRLNGRCAPWVYQAPMTEKPYVDKKQMIELLKKEGIEPPRLYALGFSHNNCGGFCVKAGQAHFALLLRTMPERYAFHEAKEEEMREMVGDHAIMQEEVNGKKRPLSLKVFRERIQKQCAFDFNDWGGCGCAIE